MKFQIENAELFFNSNEHFDCFRIGCFDEMGLGKTISTMLILKYIISRKKDNGFAKKFFPILIVTKAGIMHQFADEIFKTLEIVPWLVTALEKSEPDWKQFPIALVSYDTIWRCDWIENNESVKTLVLDECQQIKNSESKRTKGIRSIVKDAEKITIKEDKIEKRDPLFKRNVIALSGTPIKNHAGEYFPILNILEPKLFPSEWRYLSEHCKPTGSNRYRLSYPEDFKRLTSHFIIRHTREEVLPDLPKIRRNFSLNVLADELKNEYQKYLQKFMDEYDGEMGPSTFANILAYMTRMRHLTGLSKVQDCLDQVEEFMESCDRKITIFHHHHDVGDRLARELEKLFPNEIIHLSEDGINDDERNDRVREFVTGHKRILLASSLKSGEGLNLQICSDAIVVERQWNPANEEQAEGRFSRIGSVATAIQVKYLVAVGTIDEFFSNLIEEKRQITTEAMSGETGISWAESDIVKELARKLYDSGRKAWTIDGSMHELIASI